MADGGRASEPAGRAFDRRLLFPIQFTNTVTTVRQAKKSVNRFPPGPRSKTPLAGYMVYRRGMLRTIERLARDYGDISYFRVGPRPAYFVNHPDYIREVLVTGNQ